MAKTKDKPLRTSGMESAMNLENAPQSSAADLSNFLTKERLTAALRDVAQLKINEAMYLSRLSALEYKLQSSPATPSTVQMTPSPTSLLVSAWKCVKTE